MSVDAYGHDMAPPTSGRFALPSEFASPTPSNWRSTGRGYRCATRSSSWSDLETTGGRASESAPAGRSRPDHRDRRRQDPRGSCLGVRTLVIPAGPSLRRSWRPRPKDGDGVRRPELESVLPAFLDSPVARFWWRTTPVSTSGSSRPAASDASSLPQRRCCARQAGAAC